MDEPPAYFGIGDGCPTHGDEHMKECAKCGGEFCGRCVPKSTVCADCAEEAEDEGEDADFEDVRSLDALPIGEEESSKAGDDEIPPADLVEGEAEDDR